MQREYLTGSKNDVNIFTGIEIEKTPVLGKKTLFVVGIHPAEKLEKLAKENDCNHIYLGANHSYAPMDWDQVESWDQMARKLLESGFWITLDIDSRYYEISLDLLAILCCYDTFIPMISIKLPYITNLNYNTCIKIDDRDFKSSNPGVWVHHLHDLKDRSKFTEWEEYSKDLIIEQEKAS
jgi:hypothetical protein